MTRGRIEYYQYNPSMKVHGEKCMKNRSKEILLPTIIIITIMVQPEDLFDKMEFVQQYVTQGEFHH